jgi:hypothetical protein
MEITLFQLILNSISTGVFTKIWGWSGFIGSLLGALFYFLWARQALFG